MYCLICESIFEIDMGRNITLFLSLVMYLRFETGRLFLSSFLRRKGFLSRHEPGVWPQEFSLIEVDYIGYRFGKNVNKLFNQGGRAWVQIVGLVWRGG